MHDTLERIPTLMPLYFSAAFKRKAGLDRGESVPLLSAQAPFQIETQWLQQYLEICEWSRTPLPLTAPQVYAAPIHTYLLAHQQCPVPMLGLVHAGNRIISREVLPLDTPLEIKVWFGETRWKAKGYEFDLHTAIRSQDDSSDWSQAPWQACTSIFRTVSSKHQQLDEHFKPQHPKVSPVSSDTDLFVDLAANLGRRYGKIAGDRNPIHLYPWSAKLFGFKKPIMHGMWSLARSLAFLEQSEKAHDLTIGQLDVRFKKPVELPSQIRVSISSPQSADVHQQDLETSIYVMNHKDQLAISATYF